MALQRLRLHQAVLGGVFLLSGLLLESLKGLDGRLFVGRLLQELLADLVRVLEVLLSPRCEAVCRLRASQSTGG